MEEADFHEKFDACSQVAAQVLPAVEEQARASYQACEENSDCQQNAKNIQTIVNLRAKVGSLGDYVRTTTSDEPEDFLSSEVGQIAKFQKDWADKTVPINENPEFLREMSILSNLVCP